MIPNPFDNLHSRRVATRCPQSADQRDSRKHDHDGHDSENSLEHTTPRTRSRPKSTATPVAISPRLAERGLGTRALEFHWCHEVQLSTANLRVNVGSSHARHDLPSAD
jgi:hypothetical protein